ncbi:hypothetical protein [Dokdonia sp. Hel_I_53]|uniref:hypothetical protein n=1 Tax=Dokdonia sp. Hel_I_53 TaxID=1566287 RepID=UPI00119B8297|nr:hypothetical protein [Dokdonia sp. Hel_I_53]TVZ53450.1 hypothetical protein OD90_2659 [Dokdonia sp. Hel_I_53]
MIKKTLALAALFLTIVCCDKLDDLTKFNIDYNTEYTIPASSILGTPFEFVTPEVTTNSQQEFENNDTNADLVESVKLRDLTLTIQSPTTGDFDFLNEIFIYINADGLEEILIASKSGIQEDGSQTLDLDVENVELREYILKDSYTLRTQSVTDQTIEEDHVINIYTNFRVDAKILGL